LKEARGHSGGGKWGKKTKPWGREKSWVAQNIDRKKPHGRLTPKGTKRPKGRRGGKQERGEWGSTEKGKKGDRNHFRPLLRVEQTGSYKKRGPTTLSLGQKRERGHQAKGSQDRQRGIRREVVRPSALEIRDGLLRPRETNKGTLALLTRRRYKGGGSGVPLILGRWENKEGKRGGKKKTPKDHKKKGRRAQQPNKKPGQRFHVEKTSGWGPVRNRKNVTSREKG